MKTLQQLVRKNIQNLQPYSSARDEFKGKEGIFLDANENPFDTKNQINRYPDPQQKQVKAKLSELKNVPVENIFLGNGSDEVIDLVFRIFCEPKIDKALTFSPTYGMYEVSANINEVELLKMPLNADFQIDWKNDFEKLGNYLKDENLKLIFICSPNNPTANDILLTSIEFILNNFSGIVIIDEAYIDFSQQISLTQKIAKYPNLIVMQTFSKAWGMAGVRVGMAFSNSEIINYFNKVKPPYNISSLNQQAILEKLNNYQVFENEVAEILSQRTLLINELQKLPKIQKIYPSQANFILIAKENADFVYNELVNQKIVVRNRHKIVANCLRISVGTPQENELLLKALSNI